MKSILLCENPLIKHQDGTKNLKENSKDKHLKSAVKLNGTADNKKSESQVPDCSSEKNENVLQNGNNSTTGEPSDVKVCKNGQCKTADELNCSAREKCVAKDGKSTVVTMDSSTSNNYKSDSLLKGTNNSCEISKNLQDNLKARNSSKGNSVSEKKKKAILSVKLDSFDEVINEVNEILIIEDNERVTEKTAINLTSKNEENGFSSEVPPKNKVEEHPLSYAIFDVDSNKENLKDEKTNSVEDLPKDGEEGSGCEIQVEKVQSVANQDSDFVWLSSDPEKSQQNGEATQEKESEEAEDVYTCHEELQKSPENDCQALTIIDNVNSEHLEGELQMEVDEADQETDLNEEESKNEQTEWDEASEESASKKKKESSEPEVCLTSSKKRSKREDKNKNLSAKKIKLLANKNFENSGDELKVENFTAVDAGDLSKVDETSFEAGATEKATDKEKIDNAEDLEKREDTAAPTSSFLATFKDSLKNLTRSDLEELIVQKLCEVITERSTVGELRRKAQALEQDQERWKVKVQALSKQMKEMEMVMKKYMSEVQKQLKEGTNHMATPLRVTRSVGLQVSFLANPNKGPKGNISQPATPCQAQTLNTRSSKGSPKPPPQYTPISQNLRSKSMPAPSKSSPSHQKAPPTTQQRRHSAALTSTPPNRPVMAGSVTITPNRPIQTGGPGPRPAHRPVSIAQPQQQQVPQQSQQLQQQQLGSKVIDLTEDDDQRTNSTGKPNTPTRVVSHLPQSGAPSSNRYTYIVPATSTSTGFEGTQNRQVLIATPAIQTPQQNRQIMCSMPPLLFKGGNQVQPTSQPQAISQNNNRVILPKILRQHPAPLPQAPIRNWANMKQLPPRPALKISKVQTGIVLSWNMVLGPEHAPIRSYQLYAYQESNSPPTTSLWKKVGDVKALPLPMACTLTQFMSGHKYHFAVRAVDLHSRIGPFSFPGTIVLVK